MSNRTNTNPIFIDQFDTDVQLASEGVPFIVGKIRLLSAAQWDLFILENNNGEALLRMENSTGDARMTEIDFGEDGFNFGNNGVRIDVSDCTGMAATDGTDAVWIYLK